MFAEQRRAAEVRQGRGRRDGRRPFLRPARRHAALHGAGLVVRPVRLRRRPELRRLLDPRLPGDPRVRHVAVPGPDHGVHRPVPHRQDAGRELLHPRPAHRRGLLPRPAQHRPQGDGLPRQHRHRRHGVLRARGRVLRLRQRALRDQGERRLLRDRLRGRRLEHRRGVRERQPRLQGEVQGRLLPRRAVRPLRRAARRDGDRAREVRPAGRARPPRGRHRRPGGDQLPLRRAAQGRRRRDEVQVHHQERRLAQRQDRDLHAEADLRRQRLGHALPPVDLERAASRCSTTRPGTPACPTSRATTSAASSSTPRRCWRSPTRR